MGWTVLLPGDGAREDEDDYIWILGRVDDVVNVSGHRIVRIREHLRRASSVAESAVIGVAHEKGQKLVSVTVHKVLKVVMNCAKNSTDLSHENWKVALPSALSSHLICLRLVQVDYEATAQGHS